LGAGLGRDCYAAQKAKSPGRSGAPGVSEEDDDCDLGGEGKSRAPGARARRLAWCKSYLWTGVTTTKGTGGRRAAMARASSSRTFNTRSVPRSASRRSAWRRMPSSSLYARSSRSVSDTLLVGRTVLRSSMVPLHCDSARDALRMQEEVLPALEREKAQPVEAGLRYPHHPPRWLRRQAVWGVAKGSRDGTGTLIGNLQAK
jgi:hypothetical protein